MKDRMTPLERTLAALSHKEADRVPLFLLLTMHGAKELGLPLREYFSKGEHVAEGQLRLRAKYGHDCLYAFFYAALELEAWGGETIFRDDGPANAGASILRDFESIRSLAPPRVADSPALARALTAIRILHEKEGGRVPIAGVVISPFSLPVMQMGFDRYLELMHERPDLHELLLRANETFAVEWANAQLAAGATFITYFDPVSSPTIIPRDLFLTTGYAAAKRTIPKINGPVAIHLASGRCGKILPDLASLGAIAVGAGDLEDLAALKTASAGAVSLVGNLNGILLASASEAGAAESVRRAIAQAAPGGGFILSDGHGEIPLQVPDATLAALAEATRQFGRYPIPA